MEYIGSGVGLILAVAYYNYRNSLKKTTPTPAPIPKTANMVDNPVKLEGPVKGGGSKLRKNKSH